MLRTKICATAEITVRFRIWVLARRIRFAGNKKLQQYTGVCIRRSIDR
jgi:hypothetical protein